ncbi:MAG: CCA tRNA nucleotidyltransferase [Verrucomicrobiota bacterium]
MPFGTRAEGRAEPTRIDISTTSPPEGADLTRHWPPRSVALLREVARRVRGAGGQLWVVGGAVRDALLGLPSGDLDLEVFGLEEAALRRLLREVRGFVFVGKSFPVWRSVKHDLDIALPRRERATGPRHQDFAIEVDPRMPLAEAAARRDFTLNAIFFDPLENKLADPADGVRDLALRCLRHVSAQFSEDALRVLRAMQFAARFDLEVAPSTVALCRRLESTHLPLERIGGEWEKLFLKGRRPSRGLEFIRLCGWLRDYPELVALVDCPQDPQWHPEGDVWTHTLAALDAWAPLRVGERIDDLVTGLAVLCHDFGKASHTLLRDGRWRSPEHEYAGIEPTRRFLARLTRELKVAEGVLPLVETHMRPYQLFGAGAGDSAVRRLARKAGRLDRLVRLAKADARGREGAEEDPFPAGDWLLERAAALQMGEKGPRPIVLGRHLIEAGAEPGPAFREILDELFEAQLDGAFDELEEGLRRARAALAARGLIRSGSSDRSD